MTKGTKKQIIASAKYCAGSITSIVSGIFGIAAILAGHEGLKNATDKKERKDLRSSISGGVLITAAAVITGIATATTYERDLEDITLDDYRTEEKKLFADDDDDEPSYTAIDPKVLEEMHRKEELNKKSGYTKSDFENEA